MFLVNLVSGHSGLEWPFSVHQIQKPLGINSFSEVSGVPVFFDGAELVDDDANADFNL